MKYSEELVWKAVGEFMTDILSAKALGCRMNLPSALKDAAAECFLISETTEYKTNLDKVFAASIIRSMLQELHSVGWMTFGSVNEYWI